MLHSIADALQLSTEQLLSQAGWTRGYADAAETNGDAPVGAVSSVEDAIRADPRLSAEQRTALLGVYKSFVDG